MGGFATYDKGGGIPGTTVYADNFDFRGNNSRSNTMTSDGQLIIGSTAALANNNHIGIGKITSPLGTITIGYSTPNITIDVAGSSALTFNTQSGNAVPVANILSIFGATTGAGSSPLVTTGSGNTVTVTAQRAQALVAADSNKVGLSNFDSARFTVDVNGFVSLNGSGVAETITGDSGGALNPTTGNWNILGRSGSKTSGSGSTLTIKSPPYSDQGGSTTVTLNSGSFATAAITLTLPASAGLADGDIFEFICTTAGQLTIQAVGTQQIRIGSAISSAAGTAKSNAIGDSLTLRFRATDGFFYATSVIGTWTTA